MIRRIRGSFWTKVVTVYLLINLVGEIVFPTVSFALTNGPVNIDQASFEPAATSEMVDLATGDFTYNIPLLDVDGYPINLAYHGGVDMDQEASMVGLGWTLNVGAINRSMRGLPDDFDGDEVVTEMNMRPNFTVGGDVGGSLELLGFTGINEGLGPFAFNFSPNIGAGISFNNYVGFSTELSVGFSAGVGLYGPSNSDGQSGGIASIGFNGTKNSNSRDGLTTSLGAGFSVLNGNVGIGIGYSKNTAEGLMSESVAVNSPGGSYVSSFPVSPVSYTPSITFETHTSSLSFDFDLGGEVPPGIYPNATGSYFQSITCNENVQETAKAYGYMNSQHSINSSAYLHDYNREGVVLANENIANLPITNHTYDFYSATAQGVGFSFRSHRSEVGLLSDMPRMHGINGVGVSAEAGYGNIFQAGVNVDIPYGYSSSKKWTGNNALTSYVQFVDQAPDVTGIDNKFYETHYFKKFGNRSGFDDAFYNSLGGTKAIKQKITKSGLTHSGESYFIDKDGATTYNANTRDHYKTARDKRNTTIQHLSAAEATAFGLTEVVSNYQLDNYNYSTGMYPCSTETRFGTMSVQAKAHHMSEMTVLEGDGSRYVYGIPVINHTTREVVFNISEKSGSTGLPSVDADCQTGLVNYSGGADNSVGNLRGDNNLYMGKTIPAYASSYLLTAYLSSNYIDRTLDGPTPDDFGNYTKFNYAKTGTVNWRFPFEENMAAYNEGLKADEYDDLGTYVYGERDQWYIHSIESKNFVAEFHYGDRHDGYGVETENGGIASTNFSKRLVKIELYTRQEKMNPSGAVAVPIKTVHFEYDYLLCQNVPNNDLGAVGSGEEGVSQNQGGKLTLKAIYFTYGNSNRGKLHKYTFDYNALKNKDYQPGAEDRWGTYKMIASGSGCGSNENLTNIEYPYAEQDKTTADANAGSWMLETIHLPSGSEINVEIESDDYRYVQDFPVTRMYKIQGFSSNATLNEGTKDILYSSAPQNYLHVQVGNLGNNGIDAKANLLQNYLLQDEIYFRVLVEVTPTSIPSNFVFTEPQYEYISGYAEVDRALTEVIDEGSDGSFETVALKLKDVTIEDETGDPATDDPTNPVAKASWQFTRKYLPKIINPVVGSIYDLDNNIVCDVNLDVPEYPEDGDIESDPDVEENGSFLNDLVNIGKSHLQNSLAEGGINKMLAILGYSSHCVPEKSWVRLGMGQESKLGGGHRVKQITVNDNWHDVKASESASVYGSVYTYETVEQGVTVSSGVASYEPIVSGGDENPMRSPEHYTIEVNMRVDDSEFQEFPYGESIFGQSNVAYSKVTVSNIAYDEVTQNSTGKTVYEHYTAKDFPVQFEHTGYAYNSDLSDRTGGWTSLFSGETVNYLTMSQGYSIHLNDMHGKFRSKKVYGAQIDPLVSPQLIYSMEHKYYTAADNPQVLDNLVSTVDPEGTITNRLIGRDIDVVVDANQAESVYNSQTFQAGIDVFFLFITIPLPSVWYKDISIENRYRSSVTTKVINSTGILEEVVLWDKGRYKSSRNLLFDANTGVPVVTEINHEQPVAGSDYERPIYQYDYPAYWMYEGMGLASENWGARFGDIVDNSGSYYQIDLTNKEVYLNPGDELAVYNSITNAPVGKFWVVEDETNGNYYLVDEDGSNPAYTPADVYYQVIRSGKRNLLGSTAASVTSLTKYSITSPYADGFVHSDVLNASAVEYTDRALGYTSSVEEGACGLASGLQVNPYQWGLRGNWNLLTSYVYDHERNQTTGNSRIDGVLSEYVEFWENNLGVWEKNGDASAAERWIQAAVATLFDREGFNLESKDALGIYSSILLGYNRTLKVAEAVNARYYQIGFDGFEDRSYDQAADCTTPHFRFSGATVSNAVAHSGRYSAWISGGGNMATLNSAVKLDTDMDDELLAHDFPYELGAQDLIDKHTFVVSSENPTKYVLSFWTRVGEKIPTGNTFDQLSVEVAYNGTPLTNLEEHRTHIIYGWQRIEVTFELPALTGTPTGSENCEIRLKKSPNAAKVYFDDVRIQPFNSEMVSYVIDPVTLRLWATLDSRNFATFYQYDEEGSLVRIIQETERGRVTVQENRAGIRIN